MHENLKVKPLRQYLIKQALNDIKYDRIYDGFCDWARKKKGVVNTSYGCDKKYTDIWDDISIIAKEVLDE